MSDLANQQTETPGQATPNDGEGGFGAAFAERSLDPTKRTEDEDGEQPSDQEPAPARSDEAPAEAAAETADSGEARAFDPWEGLTPEQKSHFQRIESSERSNRGRVGALARKLNGYTAPAPVAAPKVETEQGAESEGGEAEASVPDLDKRLQNAVDEYGDVIGPVAEVLKEVRAELASMKGTVSAVEEELGAQELADAYEALGSVHPDFAALAVDTNYAAWLGDQPKQIVELANSFDPTEVSLALTLFKTERSAAIASQTGDEGDQGQQVSTATDDKRRRQLEGSKVISNRGAPAAAGTPNDFGSAFKARAAATAPDNRR